MVQDSSYINDDYLFGIILCMVLFDLYRNETAFEVS